MQGYCSTVGTRLYPGAGAGAGAAEAKEATPNMARRVEEVREYCILNNVYCECVGIYFPEVTL